MAFSCQGHRTSFINFDAARGLRVLGYSFGGSNLTYEKNYEMFMKTENLSELQNRYNKLLVNINRDVCVLEPQGEYSAHSSGINEQGELIVVTSEGEEKHIFAGEVSVRGIYGYV